MSKEKISKSKLLTRGQNNNKLWYNYGKGVITASKAHSFVAKMNKILKSTSGCVSMWSLCQNLSRISFTNLDLPALKYGPIMEMEAANNIFELMKKKHKNLIISECSLFLDKTNCFIGANPHHLMTCNCCEDAYIETKCPLPLNYEKPDKKGLDYLYKSDSEIKLIIYILHDAYFKRQ